MSKLGPIQQKALRSVFLQPYRSHIAPFLSSYNILKVDQLVVSVRAKFIHNLRISKLPAEFNGFVSMVDINDENFRNLRLSNFNYCLDTDVSSPKYSICKSWNNLSFEIKSTQPDEFLDTLRNYFNSCNDKICQIENCWLCGSK